MMVRFDRIVIGAGLYGLYAAARSAERGMTVLVLECANDSFRRSSYVNQARIHNGLHYPRSLETALKCGRFYRRFIEDHHECVNEGFEAVYAVAAKDSLVGAHDFENLMGKLGLDYQLISASDIFLPGSVEAAYKVREATFDPALLRQHYMDLIVKYKSLVEIRFGYHICDIRYRDGEYVVNGEFCAPFLLNTTYASTNQVASMLTGDLIDTKHELCEVVLCDVSGPYENLGITVMDGGFFSLMPWGSSSIHTLTSVHHTPHFQCHSPHPQFECMSGREGCSGINLADCNECQYRPQSAFNYMMAIVERFLQEPQAIKYNRSLYAVKTVLSAAENDDRRPTVIRQYEDFPGFYSVLSGKISTVYELDDILV